MKMEVILVMLSEALRENTYLGMKSSLKTVATSISLFTSGGAKEAAKKASVLGSMSSSSNQQTRSDL
jgi:hypothetical protein